MFRCTLVSLTLFATACTLKFPDGNISGEYACGDDRDCKDGFKCFEDVCVAVNACDLPIVDAEISLATEPYEIYVGFGITGAGEILNSNSECPVAGSWWVCDAPVGSTFSTTGNGGCDRLSTDEDLAFFPDHRGTYTLEFRGANAGGESVVPFLIEAHADAIFIEVFYTNPHVLNDLLGSLLASELCHVHADSTACATDSTCVWNSTLELCWTECAGLDETNCSNADFACSWDSDSSTCSSEVSQGLACYTRGPAGCAADPDCAMKSDGVMCLGNCASFTNPTSCQEGICAWDEALGICNEPPFAGVPQSALVQTYSDGQGLAPLRYAQNHPGFRYDPNGAFSDGPRVGMGLAAAWAGMSSTGTPASVAASHMYFYDQPQNGAVQGCDLSNTLVLWRAGAQLGEPVDVVPLSPVQADLQDLVTSGTPAFVYYPDLVYRADDTFRALYGYSSSVQDPGDMNDCAEQGDAGRDFVFTFSMLIMQTFSPLITMNAEPIYGADFDPTNSTTAVYGQVTAPAGHYSCLADVDCGSGGTCNTTNRRCNNAVAVHGYLPRLVADGGAVIFSHTTCASGYGTVCASTRQGDPGVDYDLMVGVLSRNGAAFELRDTQLLSADAALAEVDPMLRGPLFGTDGNTQLYYLGIVQQQATISTSLGSRMVPYPTFGLYQRDIDRVGPSWAVTPAADVASPATYAGSAQVVDVEDFSCELGGAAGMMLLTTVRSTNPMQLTVSPDGRYIAFARITQDLICDSGGEDLTAGAPIAGDVFVVDLDASVPTPVRAYPDACLTRSDFGNLNVAPTFIAGGAQLVFTSQVAADDTLSLGQVFRLNTADLDATDCRLVPVVDLTDTTAALRTIDPALTAVGAALPSSRTYTGGCALGCGGCTTESSCNAIDGPLGFLLAAAWLRYRKRRRQPQAPTR